MKLGQSVHTLTRSASLTDYEHVARSVGLDPFRMLRLAKLPATVLDDPNLMISADSVGWLLEESARLSGQEAFGLLLAETRSLANLGMLALVLREEPTLRAAMQSGIRYVRLHNAGVQMRLDDAGDVALLHMDANMRPPGIWRQTIEQSVGIGFRIFRALSGNTFRPTGFCFAHERPASLEVHHRVLGTAIEFSQECNAIVCRGRDLDLPIPAADPTLNREVKRWLDMQLANVRDEPAQRARQIARICCQADFVRSTRSPCILACIDAPLIGTSRRRVRVSPRSSMLCALNSPRSIWPTANAGCMRSPSSSAFPLPATSRAGSAASLARHPRIGPPNTGEPGSSQAHLA